MKCRVLVVDDEKFVRELVRDTLRLGGGETETAEGGRQALEMLSGGAFDLVITDALMPEMSGLDLLKRIRRQFPRVKVIVLTAQSRQYDISEFLLEGAQEYLLKPFLVPELLAAVERVLGGEGRESARGV